MKLPRFVHRLYAKAMGYYWLPCCLCGRMYGGHEASESVVVKIEGREVRRMVCGRHQAPFPFKHVVYHRIEVE